MDYLGGSPDNDKMGKNISKLIELVSDHISIMEEEEENLIRITKKIQQVEQPFKNILEFRFIEGMKIEELSVKIDKEYRYTKKLIKKSILKYAEL